MAAKRDSDNMEVASDHELEDAIFEELSKKQKTEESFEDQWSEAFENIQDQAALDRQKLINKACEFYAQRNGNAPSVDELEDIFEDLADKFAPEPNDDASSDSSSSDSEEDEEDLDVISGFQMSKNVEEELTQALDGVYELAQQKKAELKKKYCADISAEETEAVFSVLKIMYNEGPHSVTQGDADETDADYEPTAEDRQKEKEDAEVEESEGEEENDTHVCLDGELEFTSPTNEEEVEESEEQTIEYSSNIEVSEKLVEQFKNQGAYSEADITDVLTTKITDAEFDDADDEDYQQEPDQQEDEESVYEEVDSEEEAPAKFVDAEFGDDDGEEYTFDDFAADHQDEQDSDEESASSEEDSADEQAETQQAYSNLKSRSSGMSVEQPQQIQSKQMQSMEIDQGTQVVA